MRLRFGTLHALEENLRRVGRAHAELVELARNRDALRFHRHADQRFVAMFGTVAGIGEQAHPIGLSAIGDPHLAAIDDVIVAVRSRVGFDLGDVGAGAGFRHADAGDHIAGNRGREKLPAQGVRAEPGERGRRHIGMDADRHRNGAAVHAAEFFRHHQCVRIIEARAAELDRLVQSEKAEIPELLEQLMRRKLTGRLPFVDMRIDLGGDEFL